jgi:hypothetical protein
MGSVLLNCKYAKLSARSYSEIAIYGCDVSASPEGIWVNINLATIQMVSQNSKDTSARNSDSQSVVMVDQLLSAGSGGRHGSNNSANG